MTVPERRKREKEQRRRAILDAAENLFFSKGIEATTMEEVAEQAELAKGTLYLYFKNKDDLIFAIVHRALTLLHDYFSKAVKTSKLGREKLLAIGRAYIAYADTHSHYFSLLSHDHRVNPMQQETVPHQQICMQTGISIHQITADAIETGKRDGTLQTSLAPMELAILLWGQTMGVIQTIHQDKEWLQRVFKVDGDRLIDAYFELVATGLRPHTPDNKETEQ
ncbi:TetR/AcrR family transcriptional regulator [candidate division KSB1 bacterium]|nr:TetR/AcrR family transcriptional regulator [candidate division KSB1 bacterium]